MYGRHSSLVKMQMITLVKEPCYDDDDDDESAGEGGTDDEYIFFIIIFFSPWCVFHLQ